MSVIVYDKDNCQQCRAVERWLRSKGIPFRTKDATEPENLEYLKGLGYLQAPVTFYGGIEFSGFNPGALEALKEAYEADHPQTELS